jgi:hypothetical protein
MSVAVSKIAADRNQRALSELAIKPGNGEHCFYYVQGLMHERVPTPPSTILAVLQCQVDI